MWEDENTTSALEKHLLLPSPASLPFLTSGLSSPLSSTSHTMLLQFLDPMCSRTYSPKVRFPPLPTSPVLVSSNIRNAC